MTARNPARARVRRSCIAALAVGAALTAVVYVIVDGDVERMERERIDQPASEALLSVQHLTSAVDQVLATANGVYAASGGDPGQFTAVLGPDVNASPTINGLALVVSDSGGVRVAATVGATQLLAGNEPKVAAPGGSAALVTYRHTERGYALGFAEQVGRGAAAVYLEIVIPPAHSEGIRFALVEDGKVVLANVTDLDGLTRWDEPVNLGGRELTLVVRTGAMPSGIAGLALPELVLAVGGVLTLLAAVVAAIVARRTWAVEHLSLQNRELDAALERQRAVEAELRAWQARFQTILRDSPDVIGLLHLDSGRIEILNRNDLLGHSLESVNRPEGVYALVHPDDRKDAEAHWARLAELEPDQVSETTLRMRDADGNDRYCRLRFSPLSLAGEESRTLLGLISDVTEEWMNQLREAELQEALRRSQRLEAVGQLAGGIAHDFNNVLAAVQASVELLIDDVPDGHPREYADEIHRAAERGAALVRQLLTFAQRDRAEPRIVDTNEVLAGMEPLLRRTLGSHVQLQVSPTQCSACVCIDPTHLEQVILNLAVNARDAMPDGGVLWIATSIDYDTTGGDDDRVVLSVTDTGTGIDPDIRDRMFQPFATTKEVGKGTGLGLATVMSIVQEADGTIEVITETGMGTTFEVSFARQVPVQPAAEPAAARRPVDGTGVRILLVEDDGAVRAALARSLERHRFDVTPASNGADALRFLGQHSFDLVLTDAIMPGMSGVELAEHVRLLDPTLRIILMSGYSRELLDTSSFDLQPLRKPFTTAEMLEAIRVALDGTRVEEEIK